MRNNRIIVIFLAMLISIGMNGKDLKVFQINIWQETTMVKGAFEGLVNEIVRLDPDIVMLCEIRNYKGVQFVPRLVEALRLKGVSYNGETSKLDVGVLSKYEILEQKQNADDGAVLKACINVDGQKVIVYSAHLDYTNYACYLPRGYDGVTWEKLKTPVTDPRLIEEANRKSERDEAIVNVIADAAKEKGNIILLGGDFNEPSHLDWTEQTKDLWDHKGAVVRWDCSVLLQNAGFKDSYRTKYPDPVACPGFTYAADNADATMEHLDWVPDADGRDRIDFIYYLPSKKIELKEVAVVGPAGSIVRNKREVEKTQDRFIEPQGVWPTDHKGILTTFTLYQ